MIAVADGGLAYIACAQQLFQERLPFDKWNGPQVETVEIEQIEYEIRQRRLTAMTPQRILQVLKIADALVIKDDYFSIEDGLFGVNRGDLFHQSGQFLSPGLSVAAAKFDVAAVEIRQHSI